MLRVQRAFADLLATGEWMPLAGASAHATSAGVYVSTFRKDGVTLWTIINGGEGDWTGDPLAEPVAAGARRFDVTAGLADVREVTVPARGVCGIVEVAGPAPGRLDELLGAASADQSSADARFPVREVRRVAAPVAPAPAVPVGGVIVPAGERDLEVTFRRRETGFYAGAPYVEEWKPLPPRLHDDRVERLSVVVPHPVAVAAYEVTVGEFRRFLTETGYRPVCENRFLVGSVDGVSDDAPATGVSLTDARAYAAWAGARLPTEFEWQLAAVLPGFGRLVPAVWNWTESEHTDGITRFAMLKGGSDYRTDGSDWYTDGGVRPATFSLKFLLAGLGLERSSSIGFRLAWDLEEVDR
jgi:hypothetical protein